MSRRPDGVVQFGDFEVDLRSGDLRRRGVPVPIQEQPRKILVRLLQQPGGILTREDLRRELWPEHTFVDFEHSLNAAVKRLRDTLGDSADAPRFIETVPRRGYRLIVTAPPTDPGARRDRRAAVLAWMGLALALGIVVLVAVKLSTSLGDTSTTTGASRPVTTLPGPEGSPALSPDGTQIAFVWKGDLYAKPVDSPDHIRIARNASRAAWSPDGQWIAFLRSEERSTSRTLLFVRPIGGPERSIATLESPEPGDISWSPDGKQLAVVHRWNLKAPPGIGLLSLESGRLRPLSPAGRQALGDMAPAFAPDGRSVAFIRVYSEQGRSEVLAQGVEGGDPQVLATLTGGKPWDLEWVSDGSALIASFHKGETLSGLWRIRRSGGPAEPLPLGEGARNLTLSRTTDRLAYTSYSFDCEMWEADVGRPGVPPRRLQGSGRIDWGLQLSPDGSRIAFASLRSRTNQIWVCDRDGTNCRQVTTCTSQCNTPRWSPDGRTIAYINHGPSMDIYAVGVDGGTPRLLADHDAQDILPSWSRDGRWVYFASNRSGAFQIWRVAADGGPARQVTANGGEYAVESADRAWLYLSRGGSLYRSRPDGSGEHQVFSPVGRLDWIVLPDSIVLSERVDDRPVFRRLDPATGHLSDMFQLPAGSARCVGFDVTPDARSIVYSLSRTEADIILVEHVR